MRRMTRKSLASQTLPTRINTRINQTPTNKLKNTTKKATDKAIGTQTTRTEVLEIIIKEAIQTRDVIKEVKDAKGMIMMVTVKIENKGTTTKILEKAKNNPTLKEVEDQAVGEIEIDLSVRLREMFLIHVKNTIRV